MNCDRCSHMAAIKAALAPCANCEAGRLHHQVSADAAATPSLVYRHRKASDEYAPQTGVTTLPPETEDALRKLLTAITDLEPIELLLLRHVMRGGSYASFNGDLHRLLRRLRTKEAELEGRKGGFRSLCHLWATNLLARLPALEPLFKARIKGEL